MPYQYERKRWHLPKEYNRRIKLTDLDKDRFFVRHNLLDPFCIVYDVRNLPENLDALNML